MLWDLLVTGVRSFLITGLYDGQLQLQPEHCTHAKMVKHITLFLFPHVRFVIRWIPKETCIPPPFLILVLRAGSPDVELASGC